MILEGVGYFMGKFHGFFMITKSRVFVLFTIFLICLVGGFFNAFFGKEGVKNTKCGNFLFRVWGCDPNGDLLQAIEDGDEVRLRLKVTKQPYLSMYKYIIKVEDFEIWLHLEDVISPGEELELVGKVEVEVMGVNNRLFRLKYPTILSVERTASTRGDMLGVVSKVQSYFSLILGRFLPEPHGGLVVGILLGLKSSMSRSFYEYLVNTGTVHVIAASGYNITLVARVLMEVFGKFFRKKVALVISLVGVFLYVLLAGASPAVVRSGIMGAISYTAIFFGRDYFASWALGLTSLGMLLVSPGLVDDVGFWLSVTATGGILWLSRPMFDSIYKLLLLILKIPEENKKVRSKNGKKDEKRRLEKLAFFLALDLSVSLSAQIFTLPIIINVFGAIAVASPLVNILVLWLVPMIMLLGSVKLVVGLVSSFGAYVVNLFLWLPLEVFVQIVEFFGNMSYISISLSDMFVFDSFVSFLIYYFCSYFGLFSVVIWVNYGSFGFGFGRRNTRNKKPGVV